MLTRCPCTQEKPLFYRVYAVMLFGIKLEQQTMPFLPCSERRLARRRLPTNVTEPELAEALASTAFQAERGQINDAQWAHPVQARRLMASAQPQIGVSNVSTDLDCDGCSTTDTRQQVRACLADICLQTRSLLALH